MNHNLIESLKKTRVIPIVTIPQEDLAVPLAQAILKGGIDWMEITFRNKNATGALLRLKDAKLPIYYGAGTVRSQENALNALQAGAEFLVSPGFNPKIVRWAYDHNIWILPGVDSTFGIEQAIDAGLSVLKMFPAAELGGVDWLKAMQGPYYDIQFVPTGGINLNNLKEYLTLKNVLAVGGSFLAPSSLIIEKKFDQITEICKQVNLIVQNLS
jgi:2-dehydro-3-deoxyphosphogluconate aldolase/(4S)-4-hydroxy-2-oxoglutarate aldolase